MTNGIKQTEEDKTEKKIKTQTEILWDVVVRTLKERGLANDLGAFVKGIDFGKVEHKGKIYTWTKLKREMFEGWIKDNPGVRQKLADKDIEQLAKTFVTVYFPTARGNAKLTDYTQQRWKKIGAEVEISSDGTADAKVESAYTWSNIYGDVKKKAGVFYSEKDKLGVAASIQDTTLKVSKRGTTGEMKESAAVTAVTWNKGFKSALVGIGAGPLVGGWDFVKHKFTASVSWIGVGVDVLITDIEEAGEISKRQERSFGAGLWRAIPSAFIEPIAKFFRKLGDLINGFRKPADLHGKKLSALEFSKEMEKLEKNMNEKNFNTVNKKINEMLNANITVSQRAELMSKMDIAAMRNADSGLPFYFYKEGGFFVSKKNHAEKKINKKIDDAIATLEKLGKKEKLTEQEKEIFASTYIYLSLKTVPRHTKEGYDIPYSPVPKTSTSGIERARHEHREKFEEIARDKMQNVDKKIAEIKTLDDFKSQMNAMEPLVYIWRSSNMLRIDLKLGNITTHHLNAADHLLALLGKEGYDGDDLTMLFDIKKEALSKYSKLYEIYASEVYRRISKDRGKIERIIDRRIDGLKDYTKEIGNVLEEEKKLTQGEEKIKAMKEGEDKKTKQREWKQKMDELEASRLRMQGEGDEAKEVLKSAVEIAKEKGIIKREKITEVESVISEYDKMNSQLYNF